LFISQSFVHERILNAGCAHPSLEIYMFILPKRRTKRLKITMVFVSWVRMWKNETKIELISRN